VSVSTISFLAMVNSSSTLSFSAPVVPNPIHNMAGQVVRFSLMVYAPLDLTQVQGQLHALPTGEYSNCLPKFAGNNTVTVEDHLNVFSEIRG